MTSLKKYPNEILVFSIFLLPLRSLHWAYVGGRRDGTGRGWAGQTGDWEGEARKRNGDPTKQHIRSSVNTLQLLLCIK